MEPCAYLYCVMLTVPTLTLITVLAFFACCLAVLTLTLPAAQRAYLYCEMIIVPTLSQITVLAFLPLAHVTVTEHCPVTVTDHALSSITHCHTTQHLVCDVCNGVPWATVPLRPVLDGDSAPKRGEVH
jgi:hypothetical protein